MSNEIKTIDDHKYTNISEFIEAVSNYGMTLEDTVKKRNEQGNQRISSSIWFRGQEVADWQLVPGVYRDDFAKNDTERLHKERHMAQDFRIELAGISDGHKSNAELYFLQQHYGMPTRLLDWTSNALAALFFAVSGTSGNGCKTCKNEKCECCKTKDCPECENKDCAVYMMNAYDLATTQNNGRNFYLDKDNRFLGIATSRNITLRKTLEIIYHWENREFPDFAMPVRPDQFNSRIKLQSGCFTFHVPEHKTLTNNESNSLRKITIDKDYKKEILKKLLLLGINEFTIYGDMDNLSKKLKRIYCS